ncbi:hypothetical protein RHMOL_Rhmol12G0024900 [Rhododendron molle]|uniref:Uncharacterized protein n=1 Tax=Rhododendron molle TaxID=49168 RepID=A0ACC0LEN6_RHOML|nr:hypothetical protein RHMOL_Rhmol12G0024900 [Rhododendron molle]
MTSGDWSSLPCEIVQVIGNLLGAVEDFLAIAAICRSWRSAFSNKKIWNPAIPRLPFLMLPQSVDGVDPWLQKMPPQSSAEGNLSPLAAATYFFSSERNKLYIIDVPGIHGRHCFGSQIGWIFTVNECVLDHEAHLVNPLSRLRILLPPLSSLKPWFEPNNFVRKAVTFHHRYLDIVVMAICGDNRNLALARPGYSTWVPVELETLYPCFEDVVCYGGDQIFVVRKDGSLVLCEIDDDDSATPPKAKAVSFAPALGRQQLPRVEEVRRKKVYLVESEGDLLLVLRLWRDPPRPPLLTQEVDVSSFIIFKLNFGTREWVEFEFGNRTLFVGDSYSMSFSARHGLRCQPHSIYYSDDFPRWSGLHFSRKARARPQARGRIVRDMGIFDVGDSTFRYRYLEGVDDDRPPFFSPPTWVVPSF